MTTQTRLIKTGKVRRYLLDRAEATRPHVFTRVAPSVYDDLEAKTREWCNALVHEQPSAGRTIR